MEFYCADNFFPDLLLIPLNAFEQIQWCSTTGDQQALLYKESKSSLLDNGDALLKLINHGVKGLSKYTPVTEVVRTGGGLKQGGITGVFATVGASGRSRGRFLATLEGRLPGIMAV